MRRWLLPLLILLVIAIALVAVLRGRPERGQSVAVMTFVDHPVLNAIDSAFRSRLVELNGGTSRLRFIPSNAQGRVENLPDQSRRILRQHPNVIVTLSTPVSQALMREADARQPIVYTFVTNPSDLGDELTRTNNTGLSDAVNYAGNLALLRDVFGTSFVIGMPYNPNEANSVFGVDRMRSLLGDTNVRLVTAAVTKESELPMSIQELARQVTVIYVGGDNTVVGAIQAVLSTATAARVPVFASDIGSVRAGAIAGLSVDYTALGTMTADVVYQVLRGAEPRSIPRATLGGEQLIVNVDAAQRFDFVVPTSILDKADIVISASGEEKRE